MKQWGMFAITLLLLGAALFRTQAQRFDAPVGPDAVLSLVGDTERELTRLPVSFTRISDDEEIRIGNQLVKEYSGQSRTAKDAPSKLAVQTYLNRVGRRVAGGAHRKLPYRFHYIPDPDFVNAFALPGGHVFVGAGLISLMDSEDELASVLGHELEHIDHYHCQERVQTQAALQKVPLGGLMSIPVEVFEEGYSKTQELEADREGMELAVRAGYSPLGALRLFQTLDRLYQQRARRAQTPQEELTTLALETLEGYFRSHPQPSERIAQIQGMISSEHWESRTAEQPMEVAYVFMTQRASRDLTARNFGAAESAATRSLSLHTDQTDALAILAQAQFALMEFPACLENYRQLLQKSPAAAADVDEFANNFATGALNAEHFEQAVKFASMSLEMQPNNASALIVLVEGKMGVGDFTAAGITYQKLVSLYPAEAENVVTYTASAARRALNLGHYQKARDLSAYWLDLRPIEREPLTIKATAELALADFAAAAKTYRSLLDSTSRSSRIDIQLVWSYADALSAAKLGATAVEDFHGFMVAERPVTNAAIENQIKIEYAGLALMAGDSALARDLVVLPRGFRGSPISPELMDRLGWWYYRAGKYSEAEMLLWRLAQQRPGNARIQNDLAWAELEQGEFDAAMQGFSGAINRLGQASEQWNTPRMGLAITQWRSRHVEDALSNYAPAVNVEPRWTNPSLVRAFYSAQSSQNVSEMQAEQARRLEARKHRLASLVRQP